MAMCACCASEIDGPGVQACVYGEAVQTCSGACVAQLLDVWQPAPPRLPVRWLLRQLFWGAATGALVGTLVSGPLVGF